MYIKEVTEVNDLVFKPQDDLKKPKYDKIKIWEDGWQNIRIAPPPANNSTATLDDIKKIQAELKGATEIVKQQYLNCDEDSSYYIKKYLEDNDLEYDNDNIEFLEKQCSPVIRHFKNFFNRPRPYQIADKLGMKFDPYVTPTAQTPAYPSGHAVQPRVVAHYYAMKYPEHREGIYKGAYICGWGRVQAGLHYPSDYTAGVQLADDLMGYLIEDELKEDAPVNATGPGIAMPPTMRRGKKVRDKRFYELWKRIPKTN